MKNEDVSMIKWDDRGSIQSIHSLILIFHF